MSVGQGLAPVTAVPTLAPAGLIVLVLVLERPAPFCSRASGNDPQTRSPDGVQRPERRDRLGYLGEKRKLMVLSTARRRPRRFAAQTRVLLLVIPLLFLAGTAAAGTYSVPRFSDTAVVQGLSSVTDFAFTPDGRILVLEKAGKVRVVVNGALLATAALDITASVEAILRKGPSGDLPAPRLSVVRLIYFCNYTRRFSSNPPKPAFPALR